MKGSSIILHNSQNRNLSNEEFFRDIIDDNKFYGINDYILIFKLSIVVEFKIKGIDLELKRFVICYLFWHLLVLRKSNVICFEDVAFMTGSFLLILDLQLIHKHNI